MMAASKSQYQRAIDKATAQRTYAQARQTEAGEWTVPGSGGTYMVRLLDGELRCSCPAGEREIPCYHAAAVWLRRASESIASMAASGVKSAASVNPWITAWTSSA